MKKSFTEKHARAETLDAPNAIDILTADHAQLKKLFREYQSLVESDDDNYVRKDAIAQETCALLETHALLETEIFYPAVARALKDRELLAEARIEHAAAQDIMAQIQKTPVDDNIFDARFIVLGEIVTMHFKKEEHEIFGRAREAKLDLAALGRKMADLRETLVVDRRVSETLAQINKEHPRRPPPAKAAEPDTSFFIPPPGFR